MYIYKTIKISAPTWNEEFELPDISCFVSDVQDYFDYIIKRHQIATNNDSIRKYVNEIEKRITFKIKTGQHLERLTSKAMNLLRNTKSKIIKNENGENVSHLEVTEVVLINCNIVNNDCQQDSIVLYTFVLNKLFGELFDISSKNFIF